MAHTIQEMQEARRKVCQEVAQKLAEFEDEYNVKICSVDYGSKRAISELGEKISIYGVFEMEVTL